MVTEVSKLELPLSLHLRPSLSQFERQLHDRNYGAALTLLVQMLDAIDKAAGGLAGIDLSDITFDGTDEDLALVFCTRFSAAVGRLLTTPEFVLGPIEYECLLLHHRWIEMTFALSGFRTADPYVKQLAIANTKGQLTFPKSALPRVLLLQSPLMNDLEKFWEVDHQVAALAFLHYLDSRWVLQSRAAELRERLLTWLPQPGHLDKLKLGVITLARLPEIYMHCSYASLPAKHAIKRGLMEQMRRACLAAGCAEWQQGSPAQTGQKPTVVVMVEHFRSIHSVYRTHARAVAGLRSQFRVVGVCLEGTTDDVAEALFDEIIRIPTSQDFMTSIAELSKAVIERRPSLVFHLSVGMMPHNIGLASLRLAPVQCVSHGHTATTMSPAIDYMLLPEDFVGGEGLHSETVVGLPKKAFPYTPVRPIAAAPARPSTDGIVRIALAASAPKLNPLFLETLTRIERTAETPIEFHFLTLGAVGLACVTLARATRRLKSAHVHPQGAHQTYIERLARCDLFLSPFPYGNLNGLLDAFQLGLPGVCLDGVEPHAHIDAAIFARIGLPAQLTAQTVDEYVAQVVRLIDDSEWRTKCGRIVVEADLDKAFYDGSDTLFAEEIARLIAIGPAVAQAGIQPGSAALERP